MKKLAILTIVAVVATAQEQQLDDNALKGVILRELCSWHMPEIVRDENNNIIPYHFPTAQDIVNEYNIPVERMTSILEEMIKENLAIFEKTPKPNPNVYDPKARDTYLTAAGNVSPLIEALSTFHNANTIALLHKCILVENADIFIEAMKIYIIIAGADSLPFLREVFTTKIINPKDITYFEDSMQVAVEKLREENKVADAEQITIFLNEMKQAEQPKEKQVEQKEEKKEE